MPARIAALCAETGQTPPQSQAETVRCILDSLALAYRRAVRQAADLSGQDVDVVHLVGGGARNDLLCQLTGDACGLPVVAGPVEAAALGNVLVQARSGRGAGGLLELRRLLRSTQDVVRYRPSGTGGLGCRGGATDLALRSVPAAPPPGLTGAESSGGGPLPPGRRPSCSTHRQGGAPVHVPRPAGTASLDQGRPACGTSTLVVSKVPVPGMSPE